MSEEIKDVVEILELVKEELEKNDENISAILDLKDLKALKKLYDLYKETEKERDGIYNDYQDIGKENLKLQEELEQEKEKHKNTGKLVKNKIDGKIGIVLREWETGQIQVLEKIQPEVINTHDSWKTLEVIEDE